MPVIGFRVESPKSRGSSDRAAPSNIPGWVGGKKTFCLLDEQDGTERDQSHCGQPTQLQVSLGFNWHFSGRVSSGWL